MEGEKKEGKCKERKRKGIKGGKTKGWFSGEKQVRGDGKKENIGMRRSDK